MEAALARAWQLMGERRYQEAADTLLPVCSAEPAALAPWSLLGRCFIGMNKPANLLNLVELRQHQAGDGPKLFYDCLFRGLAELDRAAVQRVIEATPRDNLLFVVALFVAGIAAATEGETERAIELIKSAGAYAKHRPEVFSDDPYMHSILVEHQLLEDFETIAQIEATDRDDLIGRLRGIAPAAEFHGGPAPPMGAEKFIFYAACDERYLDRFGETQTRALDATGARTVFHLHIVDPTPELGAKIERLRGLCTAIDLRYSTERVDLGWLEGYRRASYFACSRLVRLPEILARYGRDVFMWDMDTEGVTDLRGLVEAMADHDLGYFEMKNTRPSLICHLAAVYYADTAATRRLAELTAKYVLVKLAGASFWLLDQTSLFCASRYLQRQMPGFRINDFNIRPGVDFYDMVRVAGSSEEKQGMRSAAGR